MKHMLRHRAYFLLAGFVKERIAKNPFRVLVLGLLGIILIGTLLLAMPFSTRSGVPAPLIDAWFTAISATCITGFVAHDTYSFWSPFGQIVILIMFQIGGIGFMTTATLMAMMLRRHISLRTRLVMVQSLNLDDITGIVRLTRHVAFATLLFESAGALILSIRFSVDYGFWGGVARGIFHSVSAFCNAGFDILGDRGVFSSLNTYSGDMVINITVMLLAVIGGMGFFVWEDIYRKNGFCGLEVHSRIVLITTAVLILVGALFFFTMEYNNPDTIGGMPLEQKVAASFLQSVTPRSVGFTTINQSELTGPSKTMTVILMFVGGSPGSTAGGIKTVAFSVLLFAAFATLRGRSTVSVFRRTIPRRVIVASLAVTMISIGAVILSTLVITIQEKIPVSHALFESTSAMGTVGLSLGLTPSLSVLSKLVLSLLMFFGRVGIMSIGLATQMRLFGNKADRIKNPEGRIMI